MSSPHAFPRVNHGRGHPTHRNDDVPRQIVHYHRLLLNPKKLGKLRAEAGAVTLDLLDVCELLVAAALRELVYGELVRGRAQYAVGELP